MKPKVLARAEVDKFPGLVWNAFIDIVCTDKYDDLSPEQRPAHLVFMYYNEVYNGGHQQYFHNRGVTHLSETLTALIQLDATCQHTVLRDAADLFFEREREKPISVSEYVDESLEEEFSDLDERLNECSPTLEEHLENHLNQHQSTFVMIE